MSEIERGTVIQRASFAGYAEDANGKEVYFMNTEAARIVVREGVVTLEERPFPKDIYEAHKVKIPAIGHEIVFRRFGPKFPRAAVWAPAKPFDDLVRESNPSQEVKDDFGNE